MKNLKIYLLLTLFLVICACSKQVSVINNQEKVDVTESVNETSSTETKLDNEKVKNYPRVDGSTTNMPMMAI